NKVEKPEDVDEVQKVVDHIGRSKIDAGIDNPSSSSINQDGGSVWKIDGLAPKQESVGSLSFTVIDASSRKEDQQKCKNSDESSQGVTSSTRKPVARAKVPFEKGYSPMDWFKLARTHPDLAGLQGQSNRRHVAMNEVKEHQFGSSMWTVLKGRVYNIAPYMKFHPGGVEMLGKAVGKDCTSLFNKYHGWVNSEFLLEKCLVGILDE
ncbi:hypothetical protein M569_13314, partial [Genlisea aurea]